MKKSNNKQIELVDKTYIFHNSAIAILFISDQIKRSDNMTMRLIRNSFADTEFVSHAFVIITLGFLLVTLLEFLDSQDGSIAFMLDQTNHSRGTCAHQRLLFQKGIGRRLDIITIFFTKRRQFVGGRRWNGIRVFSTGWWRWCHHQGRRRRFVAAAVVVIHAKVFLEKVRQGPTKGGANTITTTCARSVGVGVNGY